MSDIPAKLIEIRDNEKEINIIAERTKDVLDDANNITISAYKAIPTIAYQFLKTLMEYMVEKQRKNPGDNIEINLMQLMDIGISVRSIEDGEKEANLTPYCNPGQEFKLLVKSDAVTEGDDGDDD